MPREIRKASLTAQNTFTDILRVRGKFNISISGTWAGTIAVQRKFNDGSSYVDVEAFTANTEKTGEEIEAGVDYRVGFKTGGYTSGTAEVRISKQ